jgi:hypothetical protein
MNPNSTIKKRARGSDTTNDDDSVMTMVICSFCAQLPAALNVFLPVLGRKKRAATPYCLRCYYTSSASRQDPSKHVSVRNQAELQRQLPEIQILFSECFLELQQEIAEESVAAFSKQKGDPLASMLAVASAPSKKKRYNNKNPFTTTETKKAGHSTDGGFLQNIQLPERLKKSQQQQARVELQYLARIDKSGTDGSLTNGNDVIHPPTFLFNSRRRKGSGKSIWNLAMDKSPDDGKNKTLPSESDRHSLGEYNDNDVGRTVNCTCGSNNVKSFGTITSRNGDVRKGEIWGTDRDQVITRYQCNKCGRAWNEEE